MRVSTRSGRLAASIVPVVLLVLAPSCARHRKHDAPATAAKAPPQALLDGAGGSEGAFAPPLETTDDVPIPEPPGAPLLIAAGLPETFEAQVVVSAREHIVQPEKTQTSTALNHVWGDGEVPGAIAGVAHDGHGHHASTPLLVVALGEEPGAAIPGEGELRTREAEGEQGEPLPLEHTKVDADIAGFLARTDVRQRFRNAGTRAIEAVYTFPLPTSAAVRDFVMEIGDRRIVGVVRPREEALRIYADARARGRTASLLTQERPNIFTQRVANIAPGGAVEVHITYFHTLAFDEGRFEYVFPMVVGERYTPPGSEPPPGAPSRSTRKRDGNDIELAVDIDAGVPLGAVDVPTHGVLLTRLGATRARVELGPKERIPNRDFVLRYQVAGDRTRVGLLHHRAPEGDGYFVAMVVPPLEPADRDVSPREITFVLDTSGSMSGLPIETSKEIVRRTLAELRPEDRFNIIRFAGDSGMLSPLPLGNTPENVALGRRYLDDAQGGGGTEMLKGIEAYLATPRDPASVRLVCFLTDGFVGNEAEILRAIADRGQDARWFSFGIGSSVNRYLIEGIAAHGHGTAEVVLPRDRDQAHRAARRFLSRIDAPLLVEPTLDFGDLPVADVEPAQLRDLFSGQPITIVGRYTGPARGELRIQGRCGARRIEIPVPLELPALAPEHEAIASLWARSRIGRLMHGQVVRPDDEELRDSILRLAIDYHLASPYTSFVAVDESTAVGDGQPRRVDQEVERPEGVSTLAGS